MKNTKIKAVLYARSTPNEISNGTYPIGYQLEELERYCKENDIEVIKYYYDVHSGETFNRTEYIKMMNYLEKNQTKINLLLFTTKDRFRLTSAQESNREVAKLMYMEIEPRSLKDPYFLLENTKQQMQEWFKYYKSIKNENTNF